jgi:hypothetical protein
LVGDRLEGGALDDSREPDEGQTRPSGAAVETSARSAAVLVCGAAAGNHVFPGMRGPLSDMSLTAVLRRMNVQATAHGFRSTFRD